MFNAFSASIDIITWFLCLQLVDIVHWLIFKLLKCSLEISCIFMRDWFLFIVWFGTKVMLSSQNEMGSFSSLHFRKSLCTITVDASLNICWNSPVKPSDIGVFFVGKFCFLFGVYICYFFLKKWVLLRYKSLP